MREHEIIQMAQVDRLIGQLATTNNLEEYLDANTRPQATLAQFLQDELLVRGLSRPKVLQEAQIGQTFGWYVFTGRRGIGRDNMLKLAFAMGFDTMHANRALQLAETSALCPCDRRDAIVIYCLEHGYTLQHANETLYSLGEECL